MSYKFNPFSGNFDYYEPSIQGENSTTYFTFDGTTVSLYVNGVVRQTWTTAPLAGSPIGLLLSLTQ